MRSRRGDKLGEGRARSERGGRGRRPTMDDVANEAGVSQTTVSLVLNHADGARLSTLTRERVIKAAAKLGYQPGRRGGAPPSRAATIGFICDEISTDPWTSIGFDGVREKAWERGLTVTVAVTRGDVEMEAAAIEQLASQPLLGLIYATINTRLVHPPATLPQTPTVLLNCHVASGGAAVGRARRSRRRTRGHQFPAPRRPPAHRLHQRRAEHGSLAATPEGLSPGARHRRPAV